ncbi:hypothetical protein CQA53_10725 [Helicobacter didelphidarum]|uniref:Uncharacterized protein n=1 Tax=Helicobacter didelphidarum TaxID=2040648 RepID=A0A3D8I661_9HELI|nr:hypothetical protein [Helicobacter didelphidarum]RDU60642.1 hypothetical protein CQA53_10725 [Helicobacter didelphidarum]
MQIFFKILSKTILLYGLSINLTYAYDLTFAKKITQDLVIAYFGFDKPFDDGGFTEVFERNTGNTDYNTFVIAMKNDDKYDELMRIQVCFLIVEHIEDI